MKKHSFIIGTILGVIMLLYMVQGVPFVNAADVLRYSSSAQIREVFQDESLKEFTDKTGIVFDLFVGSSDEAVRRVINGLSDIAGTVTQLAPRHQVYGYSEIPFCAAPLVVITNVKTRVRSISEDQVRGIFSGEITNWKELGGPDQDIIVVIPGRGTGAYQNFKKLALKRFEIKYDYSASSSTMVIKAVHRIPWSISFISQSSTIKKGAVKTIKINQMSQDDRGYPYFQTFYFVTKGEPTKAAKKFIDFAFSEEGQKIIKKNGLVPLPR